MDASKWMLALQVPATRFVCGAYLMQDGIRIRKVFISPHPLSNTAENWGRETIQKEKSNWRILVYVHAPISVQLQDNSSLQFPSKLSAETFFPHPLVCCPLLHRNPGSLHLYDRLFYKVLARMCKTNFFVPDSCPAI